MDVEGLSALLARRVLPELKPKLELQDYITARIPPFDPLAHVGEWEAFSASLRQRVLDEVVFKGVPESWRSEERAVEWRDAIETGKGYRIRKLRYEALPGLWIPALLYEPEYLEGRVPAVLNLNGHVGPPGKAVDYKQIRCINLAKRGLLALNPEWLLFGELQGEMWSHNRSGYLDLCGVAGLAVFFLAMQRGLDVLLEHEHADPERVAVTGLSGGGWQTIVLSALDTRVRLAAPNAGYIGLEQRAQCQGDIGDLEQNATDLVCQADYTWLTALLAPRPALLLYNQKDDCCFQAPRAKPSVYDPVVPLYRALGAEGHFAFHTNHDPGTHNYELDNRQQFYRFLNRHGYTVGQALDDEIPSADKVRSAEELTVRLAAGNADWRTLGLTCARGLPRKRVRARSAAGLARWQTQARALLGELLRYRTVQVQGKLLSEGCEDELTVRRWQFATDDGLTLPAVEVSAGEAAPTETWLAVADAGRAALAETTLRALARAHAQNARIVRVLALDMLLTGEYRVPDTLPGQLPMLLATVGERPLGIQAAQMAAVARWAEAQYGAPVTLLGQGREAGVAALVAAALGAPVAQVVAVEAPISLKVLLEKGIHYDDCPTLYAFGLLEQFDVRELLALAMPREVVLVRPEGSPSRIKRELAPLQCVARTLRTGAGVSVCRDW